MAANTFLAIGIFQLESRVESLMRGQRLLQLLMTVEALEGGDACAELVTRIAMCSSGQRLMCFGERSRRNLAACRHRGRQQNCQSRQHPGKVKSQSPRARNGPCDTANACHGILHFKGLGYRPVPSKVACPLVFACSSFWSCVECGSTYRMGLQP
jgi:hypothetical protein